MRKRTIGIIVIVIVVLAGIGGAVALNSGGTSAARDLVVTAEVGRQQLQEKVTLTGQLTRNEQRKVTASGSGRVGVVTTKDGDTVNPGQTILEIDGRAAVAEPGDLPFYRTLDVGDRGPDVAQLNKILALPGPDATADVFTDQTRTALAKWQADHGYPAAAATKSQTLTMALSPGAAYKVGARGAASTVITGAGATTGAIGRARPRTPGALVVGPSLTISGGGSVVDGADITLTITADSAFTQTVQVPLSVSGDAVPWRNYTPFDPVITMAKDSTTATLVIHTVKHTSIEHDKRLVIALSPSASGAYTVAPISAATVTVLGQTGSDALPTVSLSSSATHLTKGQPFAVTVALSQALPDNLTVLLNFGGTAQSPSDYTIPPGDIIVPAGQSAFVVQLPTVVDNRVQTPTSLIVSLAASSGYVVGTSNAVETVIESANVPELSVTTKSTSVGPGGTATFTINADQPAAKDTTVSFQLAGTAALGQDYDPVAPTVLLRAGQTSVTVNVHTIRRDVSFRPSDMIVAAWPVRVGQVLVKQDTVVSPGMPLLSLTDDGFTVTLSASASDRTKLKVGQKVTAKLSGGTDTVDGTISQLDDAVTIDDKTGAQSYKGKVAVGDLGAADGALVTIDVVLNERNAVLAVPIAAVKQNGSGADVVRVIDLARGGKITETQVTTGISEGSFIEITKGLSGGEVVIVETTPGKQ
jgi:multidrug efflux pump subunit AcrA (membrane-fusion protein)